MSIEDGKDYRNWLVNEKEHLAIKEARRMLRFKRTVFRTAYTREKLRYQQLIDGTERREKSYKPMFKTREELDAAYVVGAVSDQDYMKQRSAIWQCYSDRGHIKNLEWIQSELDKYQKALDELDEWTEAKHRETVARNDKKRRQKLKHRRTERNKYRKKKKEALERRWKYYGIG